MSWQTHVFYIADQCAERFKMRPLCACYVSFSHPLLATCDQKANLKNGDVYPSLAVWSRSEQEAIVCHNRLLIISGLAFFFKFVKTENEPAGKDTKSAKKARAWAKKDVTELAEGMYNDHSSPRNSNFSKCKGGASARARAAQAAPHSLLICTHPQSETNFFCYDFTKMDDCAFCQFFRECAAFLTKSQEHISRLYLHIAYMSYYHYLWLS